MYNFFSTNPVDKKHMRIFVPMKSAVWIYLHLPRRINKQPGLASTGSIKQNLLYGQKRMDRKATAYAEKVLKAFGWRTETTGLPVIDWQTGGATLTCNGPDFEMLSSHSGMFGDRRNDCHRQRETVGNSRYPG